MLRQSARLQLVENEMRAAHELLELASMELDQHPAAAAELIAEAEHVADVVEHILKEMPDQFEQDRIRFSLEVAKLQQAIEETRANKQSEKQKL